MWARLIVGRFRDAVMPDPHSTSSSGTFFDFFSSGPRHGVYRDRYAPGFLLFAAFGFVFSLTRQKNAVEFVRTKFFFFFFFIKSIGIPVEMPDFLFRLLKFALQQQTYPIPKTLFYRLLPSSPKSKATANAASARTPFKVGPPRSYKH